MFYGDATRLDLLETAGIASASVLLVAVDDEDDALRIVEVAREAYPQLKIITRAHNRFNLLKQRQLGADFSIREMFGSSLSVAEMVLRQIGYTAEQAADMAVMFESHA